MKIVIMNVGDARIDIVDAPDHLIGDEDIEKWLSEKDFYYPGISSWMAVSADYVPVRFITYNEEGETAVSHSRINTVQEIVYNVKGREKQELIDALQKYGEKEDGGYEYHFHGTMPCIAAYDYDEPADVVVYAVRVKDNWLSLIVRGKEEYDEEHQIDAGEVFAGHLDFVTSEIINNHGKK